MMRASDSKDTSKLLI